MVETALNLEGATAATASSEREESLADRLLTFAAMGGAVAGAVAGAVLGAEVGSAFPVVCGALGTMLGGALTAGAWCASADLFAGYRGGRVRDRAGEARVERTVRRAPGIAAG